MTKAGKDPEAPKGKTTAYLFYSTKIRSELKEEMPALSFTDLAKEAGKRWKLLSAEQKAPYEKLAADDAARYEAEMKKYKDSGKSAAFAKSIDKDDGKGSGGSKRKRADKDPNAPKKPTTAYFYFANEQRDAVKQSHPQLKFTEIAQHMGQLWNKMDEQAKSKYQKMAEADKERYAKEQAAYGGPTIKKSATSKVSAVEDDEE